MRLNEKTQIAGLKTVRDWTELTKSLADFSDVDAWTSAYTDYFLTRLEDRYLDPIRAVKTNGTYRGEGFSIIAIICSLIEFLESTYQGKNFRYIRNGEPPLGQFEYSGSEAIFVSFLSNTRFTYN